MTDRDRYRRTLQSQVERRYARSCSPSCPSCIGTEGSAEVEPDRELLTEYFDSLSSRGSIDVEKDSPNDVLRGIATMWRGGHQSVRLRFGDRFCGTVSTAIARAITERVPGNFSEVEVGVAWARTRRLNLASGYIRELGLDLGSHVS